jgi:hypothetical protein
MYKNEANTDGVHKNRVIPPGSIIGPRWVGLLDRGRATLCELRSEGVPRSSDVRPGGYVATYIGPNVSCRTVTGLALASLRVYLFQ